LSWLQPRFDFGQGTSIEFEARRHTATCQACCDCASAAASGTPGATQAAAIKQNRITRHVGWSSAQYVGLENQVQPIRRSTVEVSTVDFSRAFAMIEKNTWILLICVTMLIAMVLLLWMWSIPQLTEGSCERGHQRLNLNVLESQDVPVVSP
jgi:hypothetical protein